MKENYDDIEEMSAVAQGVVEHGTVTVAIEDTMIQFTIQQRSDGIDTVLLDDNNEKTRALIEEYGVKLDGEEVVTEEFKRFLIEDLYQRTVQSNLGTWFAEGYNERFDELSNNDDHFCDYCGYEHGEPMCGMNG